MSKETQKKALQTLLKGGTPEKDISVSINDFAKIEPRKVGDTWTDEYGYTWEQKQGYAVKHSKIGNLGVPAFCPTCNKVMSGKRDEQTWFLHQYCFDCLIEEDHKRRTKKGYKQEQKKRELLNLKAYLRDLEQGVEEVRSSFNSVNFVDTEGVEKWETPSEETMTKVLKDWVDHVDVIREKIANLEKELDENKSEEQP